MRAENQMGASETELFDAPTRTWRAGPALDEASIGVTATEISPLRHGIVRRLVAS